MESEVQTDAEFMRAPTDDIAAQHSASRTVLNDGKSKSITGTVSKIACGFALASMLHYISVACAVVLFIGGGVLCGVGSQAVPVELRYVAYGFGAAISVIGVFFAFRSFSLALALRDLEKLRGQLQETVTDLDRANAELQSTNDALKKTSDGLIDTLASMNETEASLRGQVAMLVETSERFRTAIGALVTAGSQNIDLTAMINDALKSIRAMEADLRSEREKQEAFTTKLTASILAQMDANGDGSIDAIEQARWLERMR